jgi:hypothetical protein
MSVTVPEAYAGDVRLAVFSISDKLVSVVVSSLNTSLLVGTFLKTGSGQVRTLTPIVPGVSGFVCFGQAVESSTGCRYLFSTAAQSGLEAGAVTVFGGPGVESLSRRGNSEVLTGDLSVSGDGNVILASDGVSGITVGMTESAALNLRKVLESPRACAVPPITSINGVKADADGRILIRFM